MDRFEQKFGKYAIKNLTLVLIICYAIGYIIEIIAPQLIYYLLLNPFEIIYHYQIWRIVTWIIVPPSRFSFWTLIMLYFYYSLGTSLEITWGTYRYNVYLLSGILFTVLGAFALYGYTCINGTYYLWGPSGIGASFYSMMFSTYYVNMSIFLAFAATFPNNRVYLFFIIPIKVMHLGIVYAALLSYELLVSLRGGDVATAVVIFASLLNFIVFFFTQRKRIHNNKRRQAAFTNAYNHARQNIKYQSPTAAPRSNPSPSGITRHKCAVCGQTEATSPNLSFRFCSKCNGNYEYCENHLFTHTHVE